MADDDLTAAERFEKSTAAAYEAFARALVADGSEFARALADLNIALGERRVLRALAIRDAMYREPEPIKVSAAEVARWGREFEAAAVVAPAAPPKACARCASCAVCEGTTPASPSASSTSADTASRAR